VTARPTPALAPVITVTGVVLVMCAPFTVGTARLRPRWTAGPEPVPGGRPPHAQVGVAGLVDLGAGDQEQLRAVPLGGQRLLLDPTDQTDVTVGLHGAGGRDRPAAGIVDLVEQVGDGQRVGQPGRRAGQLRPLGEAHLEGQVHLQVAGLDLDADAGAARQGGQLPRFQADRLAPAAAARETTPTSP
jgi:hypothetical protein